MNRTSDRSIAATPLAEEAQGSKLTMTTTTSSRGTNHRLSMMASSDDADKSKSRIHEISPRKPERHFLRLVQDINDEVEAGLEEEEASQSEAECNGRLNRLRATSITCTCNATPARNEPQSQSKLGGARQILPVASLLLDRYTRELESKCAELGIEHPRVAESLNTIGLLYHHMIRDLPMALCFHRRALLILRNSFTRKCNSSGTDLAVTLTDIGHVCLAMGETEAALSSYEEALMIFQQAQVSALHPAKRAAAQGICLLTCGTRCS